MRCTVLIINFLLGYSIKKLCFNLNLNKKKCAILIRSILCFDGLVFVDNIHFQYNSILFSIFFYLLIQLLMII